MSQRSRRSPYAARAQLEAAVAEIALTRYDDAFARLKTLGEQTGAPDEDYEPLKRELRAPYWEGRERQVN